MIGDTRRDTRLNLGSGLGRCIRLWLLAMLTAGTCGLALVRGGFAAWFMVWLMGGLLAVSAAVLLFNLMRVQVVRSLASRVFAADDSLQVELAVRHTSIIPVLWLSVSDRWVRAADGEVFTMTRLVFPGWKRRFTVNYRVAGLPRGGYRFAGTELVTGDLWGMAVKRRLCLSEESFTVLPDARPVVQGAVPRSRGEEEAAAQHYFGSSAAGQTVRDYVRGDPVQRIHWKSTARRGELMTRASEPAEELRYTVCLDAGADSYQDLKSGSRLFEEGIERAAGLLRYAAGQRSEAGFVCNNGRELWIPPADRTDYAVMLGMLAELAPDGKKPLEKQLLGIAQLPPSAGHALVVITPALRESMIAAMTELRRGGRQVAFIHLQSHPVPTVSDRECLRKLERAGCTVLSVTEQYREREVILHAEYAGA